VRGVRAPITKCGSPSDVELAGVGVRNREGRVGDADRGVIAEVVGEIRAHVKHVDRLQAVLALRRDRRAQRAAVSGEPGRNAEVLTRQARNDVTHGGSILNIASGNDDGGVVGLHWYPL
jgi:hypothetical protein